MSYQAYPDAVEVKTGKTPGENVDLARAQGLELGGKAGPVVAWLT